MDVRLVGMIVSVLLVGFTALFVLNERQEQRAEQVDFGTGVLDAIPEKTLALEMEQYPTREWTNTNDVLEGDAIPEDYSKWEEDSESLELFQMGTPDEARSRLIAVVEEYNELIPYGYQGRSWSYGYFKQETGYENILYDSCANGLGLDGLGYAIWLYRNALGHTPMELAGEFSFTNMKHAVDVDELRIGDFCMTDRRDVDVLYGVVCGFDDGHPIVTMCDNIPTSRFTYGCNHLAYVKHDYDQYLGNYASVDFQYFYRLDDLM